MRLEKQGSEGGRERGRGVGVGVGGLKKKM